MATRQPITKRLDSRLGTNEDLTAFVAACHEKGIRVIFDGVFNHTGRDFFAFKDIQANREHSRYVNWYCNVNFGGNTEYNDGFSYENWGGYNLLVKLNQRNPEVQNYICDVIRFLGYRSLISMASGWMRQMYLILTLCMPCAVPQTK